MTSELTRAKIEARLARKRVVSTATALQARLRPAALANQAWSGVREKGSEIADEAVEAARARPAAAAGVVAAFLLFLARGQIVSAASRVIGGRRKNGEEENEGSELPVTGSTERSE